MAEFLNILFIVPYVPNLIRVRPFNLIRHLAARGNQITLVTLWSTPQEKADLELLKDYCRQIYAFQLPVWRSYLNSLGAIPRDIPLQAVYCWQPEMARFLDTLVARVQFDVIHVEHLRGAQYGLRLRQWGAGHSYSNECAQGVRPAVVWDSVDCISLLFQQAAGKSKKQVSRWLTRFELARTQRHEGRLLSQFDHVLVTSPMDREALLELSPDGRGTAPITVLPNGVDLAYYTPDQRVKRQPATLVISGKMSYHANVTMSINFVKETMPLIWKQRPDVKLCLVGKDPAPEIRALAQNPAIMVTGTVEDIRPYLHQATAAVTPVTYGVGIQNKVLEAMGCGIPVVSSPQAVSALTAIQDKDVLVAGDPEALAKTIVHLLDDPALQERIGRAGRQYVEEHHRWTSIAAKLEEVYYEATENQRSTVKGYALQRE